MLTHALPSACLPALAGQLLTPLARAFLLPLQCGTEASATRLFDQLRASLGAGTAALCIKPAHACNGLGAMRATSGQDLMVYAQVGGIDSSPTVCQQHIFGLM